jgi:FtsZ-interacting cell division protein YlmF
MDHRTVVLNMENTAPDVMRRLLDFLSGVAFCIGGQLQQIGTRTYIITPPSIDVTGEQFDLGAQTAAPQPQSVPGAAPQNGAYPNFDPFRMQ